MDKELFIENLIKLNINPTEKQLNQLDLYYDLLIEWNNKINLTAIIELKDVYLKHYYDSLTLTKAIDLNTISTLCDVGTGAGFPGIVLKIFFPHLKVTLVDSLNKRINFLNDVIKKLNLTDIETVHTRVEDFSKLNREKYDLVTARTVTNLPNLLEYCIPLVKVDKYFIPLKGSIDEENECLNIIKLLNIKLMEKIEFYLPIENSKRIIYKFIKLKKTDIKYPRSITEIKKKPLL